MVVKKISEKLSMCFGADSEKKYIATNNGNVNSGYAYGKTEEEAIANLTEQNNQ